ncbi:hypothetical protein PsYK624_093650 [Phanerochaete sordida]|uniref:Uncharacterized protein n=1 Tax=Phanerochaete sordida TaxID=48140 RepID=A0A9P3LF51_9APHY|nr:hypothetical protein PsYK624_093650 [Phanerochaete sordida]
MHLHDPGTLSPFDVPGSVGMLCRFGIFLTHRRPQSSSPTFAQASDSLPYRPIPSSFLLHSP